MISGTRKRLLMALIMACASLAPLAVWAAAPELDVLLASLRREAPQDSRFIEVRYSKLLREPLRVAGTLKFLAVDRLQRQIDTPYRETTRIEGETVYLQREGEQERRFALRRAPELRGVLSSFGAILGGDQTTLERSFAVTVDGSDAAWQLTLTPRGTARNRRIESIRVIGHRDQPHCFVMRESAGAHSVLVVGERVDMVPVTTPDRDALLALCARHPAP